MGRRARRQSKKLIEAARHWAGIRHAAPRTQFSVDQKVVKLLRAVGAPPEAIAKAEAAADARHTEVIEDFEVWADNWPTWEAFRRVETQWLYAGLHGQRTGLNYPGVEVALGLPRVRRRRAAALFEDITLIEHAVLAADYELAQKRK